MVQGIEAAGDTTSMPCLGRSTIVVGPLLKASAFAIEPRAAPRRRLPGSAMTPMAPVRNPCLG